MANKKEIPRDDDREQGASNRTERPSINREEDIHDSQRDLDRLKPDKTTIDLPDVKDIPGQEFIHVPRLGEMEDTTISSDDEEGVGLFDDDEEDDTLISMGTETDVSKTDSEMLANMDHLQGADDDTGVQKAVLDNRDFEGDKLNEDVDVAGNDLDVSGVEGDDAMENIGEEDEENNQYSRGSDRNDSMNEGTP
jgi:hypothetical protein